MDSRLLAICSQNWRLEIYWKLEIGNSNFLEKTAFKLQYLHMKNKITREVITPTRALFHPKDWGKIIMKKLALDTV